MANQTVERILVEAKSQFGLKVGNRWLNPRKPLSVDNFVKGNEYEVLTEEYESKQGKKGTNIVQIVGGATASAVAPIAEKTQTTKELKASSPLKSRDFDAEARGKTRCALYGAALASPVLQLLPGIKTLEDIKRAVRDLAADGVAYSFDDPK